MPEKIVSPKVTKQTLDRFERGIKNDPNATDAELLSMYPELSSEEGLQDAFRYINNKKLGKTDDELSSMFGDAFPMLKKKASSDSGQPTTTSNIGQEKPSESKSILPSSGSAEPNWPTSLSQVKRQDVRPDGTKKGMGFLGPLPTKDGGIATEMSIGVEIDGKETLIPTLIPTLTKEEREWILGGGNPSQKGDPIADAIAGKAIEHAKDRMSKGQSPFAGIKTKEWSTEPIKNPFAIPRNPTSEESKRLIEMGAQTSKDRELFPDSNDIDAILGNPNFSTTNADFKEFVNPAERGNPAKRFGNERYTSEEMAGKVKRSDASIAYFMELEKKREKQIEGLSEKYQTLASAKKAEVETSVQDYSNKVNAAYKDKVAKFVASLPKPRTQEEAIDLQKQVEAFNKKSFDESNALINDFLGKKNEELKSYVETNLASEMSKEAQKGGVYYSDEDKRRVANIFSSQKFQDLPFIDQKALVGGVWYRERLRLLKQGKTPAEIADAKDYFYHTALGNAISKQQDRPTYLKPGVRDLGPNYGSGRLSSFAIRSWAEDMSADLDKRIAEQKKLLPSENLGLDQQQYVEEMKDLQSLLQAKKNIDQVKAMPDNDLGSWASGLSDANKIPLASAVVGLSEAVKLGQVASKTTRTAADDLLLMSKGMIDDLEANSNPSMAYKIGKQTGEMLPYIGEFILTGGAFTAGKAVTQKVLTETLTKKFGTWATKSVVQRSLVRPMGTLVGALAQTAVNPQMYVKNTIERMNPIFEFSMSEDAQSVLGKVDASTKTDAQGYSIGKNEDAFTAAMRGFGMAYSEMFTERLGESLLSPALKAVSKSITPEFAKRMTLATWLTKRGLTPEQGVSEILLKQMGWDGIISEMGEELINIPLTNIITDRPLAEGASGDELKVLAGSVVSMALLTGSVSLVGNMATSPVELKYRDANGEEQSIQVNKNLAKAIQYMASRTAPTEKGAVSLDYFDIQEFKDKVFGNVKMNKKDREVILGLINGIQDRLDTRPKPGLQFSPRRGAEDFQEAVYADETEAVSDMLLLGPIDQEEADVYEVQADNVPEPNIEQEVVELEVQLADQSLSDIERTSLEQRKVELEKAVEENANTVQRNEWNPRKNDLAVGLMKQYNSMTPAKKNSKKGVQLMSRISSLAGNFGLDITQDKNGKIELFKDGSKLKATPTKTDIEMPDQYDIDYAKSMLERGVVLPDVDFGITPAEAEKGMQDVLKGNMTNPAKIVVAGLKKSREFGGYDVIERDENNRPTGNKYFVDFMDLEASLNEPVLVEPDQEEKLAAEFDARMSELTDEQLEQIYLLSIDEEQELPISKGEAPVAASKEKSTDIISDEKGGGKGEEQEIAESIQIMRDISAKRPDLKEVFDEGEFYYNKMQELRNRIGYEKGEGLFTGINASPSIPFPYRLNSVLFSGARSSDEAREKALNEFKQNIEAAKEYFKNPPSDSDIEKLKSELKDKRESAVAKTKKDIDEAASKLAKLKDIYQSERDFIDSINPNKSELDRTVELLLLEGVDKNTIRKIKEVKDAFNDVAKEQASLSKIADLMEKQLYSASNLAKELSKKDVDLFVSGKKNDMIEALNSIAEKYNENKEQTPKIKEQGVETKGQELFGVKGLLTEQQSIDLQTEIESYYSDTPEFGDQNRDIRQNLFNYENPIAEKDSNGVNLRIAEGLLRIGEDGKNRKSFLLYADGKIVGEFDSVDKAKSLVKKIEENLVKPQQLEQGKPKGIKEQSKIQLFSHYNTNHGATNTIYYDNGKFIEVENYARGKEFEITKDEAIAKKWESEHRFTTPPIKQVDKDRIESEFNDKISATEVENKEQEYKQIKTIRNKLKFVDDNFNGIVAQLILKNKVKRVC